MDHPSFGTAIISRLLEAEGYKVGVLAQPRYTDCEDFKRFGKPKYGFFIGGGNVDSMVSHYSVAKIPRAEDEYSPGGKAGARPDRSATVYTKLAKQAYPDLPVILGGLEASLRRFAHYDYWLDTVLPSIAEDSGADLISFGMGEHQTVEIARRLAAGEPVETITDVNGTCYLTDFDHLPQRYVECAGFKKVASDKTAYAKAAASRWTIRTWSAADHRAKAERKVSGAEHPRKAAGARRAGQGVRPALHPPLPPHLREHGRRARHPRGAVLHHPEPRLLRRLQLLRHPAASGAAGHQPQRRQHRGGSRTHDPRAGF